MLDTSCRHCGATGLEPDNPTQKCHQCEGKCIVSTAEPNPAGPGLERLSLAAKAATPQHTGPTMMVAWDKVKTPADHLLMENIKALYGRRTRRQRRAFAALTRQAVKAGILVRAVPEERIEA